MRSVALVTVGRSDWGIYRAVASRIAASPELDLRILASGTHLSDAHGRTVEEIERDGFEVAFAIDLPEAGGAPETIARASAAATAGFAEVFAADRPDLLLVLGDRYEMHAAVVAALPFAIPVAHVHGGESTQGAIDEALRHAITKMSHLHFASTEEHARRIVQMGEEPWRVTVSGAPGLDSLLALEPLPDDELPVAVDRRTLLVAYHPVTLDYEHEHERVAELVAALESVDAPLVVTYPNADTRGLEVRAALEELAKRRDGVTLVPSLGSRAFGTLLRRVGAMVGNSSAGIIEAPSFELPVVNVGKRQEGRLRAANVIDVADDRGEIAEAIERALSPDFRASLGGLENPYGDGHASERIVERLRDVELGPALVHKRFHDVVSEPVA